MGVQCFPRIWYCLVLHPQEWCQLCIKIYILFVLLPHKLRQLTIFAYNNTRVHLLPLRAVIRWRKTVSPPDRQQFQPNYNCAPHRCQPPHPTTLLTYMKVLSMNRCLRKRPPSPLASVIRRLPPTCWWWRPSMSDYLMSPTYNLSFFSRTNCAVTIFSFSLHSSKRDTDRRLPLAVARFHFYSIRRDTLYNTINLICRGQGSAYFLRPLLRSRCRRRLSIIWCTLTHFLHVFLPIIARNIINPTPLSYPYQSTPNLPSLYLLRIPPYLRAPSLRPTLLCTATETLRRRVPVSQVFGFWLGGRSHHSSWLAGSTIKNFHHLHRRHHNNRVFTPSPPTMTSPGPPPHPYSLCPKQKIQLWCWTTPNLHSPPPPPPSEIGRRDMTRGSAANNPSYVYSSGPPLQPLSPCFDPRPLCKLRYLCNPPFPSRPVLSFSICVNFSSKIQLG